MKKIISDCATGIVSIVDLTAEEIADVNKLKAAYVPPASTPTKEELLAQLNAISAQIQALS
jgi:hypothetical protein